MKIIKLFVPCCISSRYEKTWLIMRLSIMLMVMSLISVSASTYSQSKRVSLDVNDVNIVDLFEEIKQQSDYSFFFNEDKMAELELISLSESDITVAELLNDVLSNTGYTYTMVGDVIVIKEEEVKSIETQQDTRLTIKGYVSDYETGELLPGVNILVKGGMLGAVTDINGQFEMLLPRPVEVLVFSFIGYETQEVKLEGRIALNVRLIPEIRDIDEVVVTGYQVIDKRELTSAISTIKREELDKLNSLTIDQMLEGKATGLMVSNLSAQPGAAAKIRIRGGSTFTGNQEPLWVIDGVVYEDPVPLSAAEINSFDNINIIGNAITGINPQDIETINVLKDASATAIYGTRAANGVIVISTKRGKVGLPRFSYSAGVSYVDRPHYSDFNLMNSKERIDVSREMYERNLGYMSEYSNYGRLGYEGALMNLWDGTYTYDQFQNQVSYLETVNTDWFGELYQPAINQQHSVSASGGAKGVRYYVSLGYDDQQGTEKGVDLNRITSRANIDIDLRENMLLSFKLSGSVQKAKYNHGSVNVFNSAYNTSRSVPIRDENGDLFYQSKVINSNIHGYGTHYADYNILNEMSNSEKNIINKDLSISAYFKWNFWNNFSFNSQASYRNTTNLSEEYITEDTYYIAGLRTYDEFDDMVDYLVNNYASVPFGGLYSHSLMNQDSYSVTNQLNYKKVFNSKHVVNVNFSQEARSTQYWGVSQSAPGYNHTQGKSFIQLPQTAYTPGEGLDLGIYDYRYMINWLAKDRGKSVYPGITDRISNALSVFGIFNYVYDNRYVLNFNMRSDGSNTFGQYQRYKFKPVWSASTRWNIHNESFFNTENIDELALRGSYGIRGTMPNASPYLTIGGYGRSDRLYGSETVAHLVSFPNANLRWERTATVNVGLNYSLFKGRISGAFDYAYSKSTDLLQRRPGSLVNGEPTQLRNSGSKDVQSYEMNIRTVNIKTKHLGWSTYLNFSYDKDRVLEGYDEGVESNLTVQNYLSGSIYRTGFPTNGFFSYQFDGLNSSGIPTFKNLRWDGEADDHLKALLVYEGSRVPQYYGGFGTEFKYKNLRLSANFSYKLGYKTRLLNLYRGNQNMPYPYENMSAEFNDRWRQPGDEDYTNIPVLSGGNYRFTETPSKDYDIQVDNMSNVISDGKNVWWMYDYSDTRVVKGDHIRWQSLSLSYSLPASFLEKTGVKNANIGFQMSNVAVWAFDDDLKGQDPEQVIGVGMPNLSTYSMSLNLGF